MERESAVESEREAVERGDVWLLVFSNAIGPERLADKIGIPPDSARKRGEITSGGPRRGYLYNVIKYCSRLPPETPIVGQIADLVERLRLRAPEIKGLVEAIQSSEADTPPARLWVYLQRSEASIGFELPAWLVTDIASLGATLSISVHCRSEDWAEGYRPSEPQRN